MPARTIRRPLHISPGPVRGSRPDRVAGWAVALGLFLVVVASATSHGFTGGSGSSPDASVSARGGTGGAKPAPSSGPRTQFGERTLAVGVSGRDVRTLQVILRQGGYGPAKISGRFDGETQQAVQRLQSEKGLSADGVVAARFRRALSASMTVRGATWYGPGLYGNRTACGRRLRRSTQGVAHKRLPCGTRVTFYHRGRFRTVRVIDRGPYTRGLSWDLTAATARSLGMRHTTRLRYVVH